MIREHVFRGEDACTYKWHLTMCGKPREEHEQRERIVVYGLPGEDVKRYPGELYE